MVSRDDQQKMSYSTSPLGKSHKKKHFRCGKELLDSYLHTQASQDVKRKLSVCFVYIDEESNVKGYYTLSSTSVNRDLLPDELKKKMPPSYRDLPATLLGRLAVDNTFKGKKLGKFLLYEALNRCYNISLTAIGSIAVVVDPLDDDAINFYQSFDFIHLPGSGKMFITMDTVAQLFK